MNNRQILLVDDNQTLAEMYAFALTQSGYSVTCLYSGADLLQSLDNDAFAPDLLVLDVRLPDIDGLEMLTRLKVRGFNAPVIVITGHASVHMAVEAMQLGASDFLVKPFPIEQLSQSANRALESIGLSSKAIMAGEEKERAELPTDTLVRPQNLRAGFGGFIGISQPMQLVYDVIESAAKSNATVFITGESGTGKEICAEALHKYSRRADKPFIAINCAAIPRELVESELFGHVRGAFTGAIADRTGAVAQAHGGTLFLDEIAEMAPDMQTKLLRFLQNLTYRKIGGNKDEKANIRLICATNRDPLEDTKSGTLRQDLYYRLHVIPVHMPPLRHRRTDIIDLADYFLKLYAREEGKNFKHFSPEAERILLTYPWPGNVRQLQNIVRGITVFHDGRFVTPTMLPPELGHSIQKSPSLILPDDTVSSNLIHPLWKVERTAIEHAIALCAGNIPKAAAMLEISPSTIYRKKMSWDQHMTGFHDHGGFSTPS